MIFRGFRCLVVWLLATVSLVGISWLAGDNLVSTRSSIRGDTLTSQSFETLLIWLCSALLLGCCLWLWLTTTVVVLGALRGRTRDRIQGCPDFLRRGLLVACGVAIAGSLAVPAHAASFGVGGEPQSPSRTAGSELIGLPLPDRAERTAQPAIELTPPETERRRWSTPIRHDSQPVSPPRVITVKAGDTLWDIAAHSLGPDPSQPAIAERCAEIHALNQEVIGADPDRIFPGQDLRLTKLVGE